MRNVALVLVAVLVAGCRAVSAVPASPVPETTAAPISEELDSPTVDVVATPSWADTLGVSPIPTESPVAAYGLACLEPPDDYVQIELNGEVVNRRTVWMLERAQELYDGQGDLLRITQGSYTDAEPGSFGTHSGGGAVDISIRNPENPSEILREEVEPMIAALRLAGFAAWYRAPGDLGTGSPAHIHAIAIGDQELSPAAVEQIEGSWGYLHSMDGLPPPLGPNPDRHGGPVICDWMVELGYDALQR